MFLSKAREFQNAAPVRSEFNVRVKTVKQSPSRGSLTTSRATAGLAVEGKTA